MPFSIVVPVKELSGAKSRLGVFAAPYRQALALAMALDTVSAALTSPMVGRVVVVCDDPRAAGELSALGAIVIPDLPASRAGAEPTTADASTLPTTGDTAALPTTGDAGTLPAGDAGAVPSVVGVADAVPAAYVQGDGLNAALRHGGAHAVRLAPGDGVAALTADLPALTPEELTAALSSVQDTAFVADLPGDGTTLYATITGDHFQPQYGPDSAARHRTSGAKPLDGGPGLRRDVDTPADLREAVALGVGPHTRATVARIPQFA